MLKFSDQKGGGGLHPRNPPPRSANVECDANITYISNKNSVVYARDLNVTEVKPSEVSVVVVLHFCKVPLVVRDASAR